MRAELVTLPIGQDYNFTGLIDLIEMKAFEFCGEGGKDQKEI
jgi:hypothetical protein